MCNSNNFFIHIGPPKTATSSFQRFFSDLREPDIYFESINHTECGSLYLSSLRNTSFSEENRLSSVISKKRNVIFSHENFLLDEPQISWQKKMKRMFVRVNGLNPVIIIVLRKPSEGIRSFYQQWYDELDKNHISSINDLSNSNLCKIYNYEELESVLKQIGFKNIIYLSFKKLVSGRYHLKDLFDTNSKKQILLPHKKISGKKRGRAVPNNQSLKGYLRGYFLHSKFRQKIYNTPFHRIFTKLWLKLPDKRINRNVQLDVDIDADILNQFNSAYYKMIKKAI